MNFIEYLSEHIKNPYLLISLVSLLPFSEIKGGILLGLSLKLNPLYTYGICFLSSSIPIPIIILTIKGIVDRLKKSKIKKIAISFEKGILAKFSYMGSTKHIFWKLLCFVGVPIPLTGAYSGSCLSALLELPVSKGFFSVILGNAISGLIILAIGVAFQEQADKILLGFLSLIPIIGIISLIKRKKSSRA